MRLNKFELSFIEMVVLMGVILMLNGNSSCYSMILEDEIITTVCLSESPSSRFMIENKIHHAIKTLLGFCISPSTKSSCNRYMDYVVTSMFLCVIKKSIQALIYSINRKYDSFLTDLNSNTLDVKHVMPYLGKTVKAMI